MDVGVRILRPLIHTLWHVSFICISRAQALTLKHGVFCSWPTGPARSYKKIRFFLIFKNYFQFDVLINHNI